MIDHGLATDLMIAARMGTVEVADGYRVVRTPTNPAFHSGNALVIPAQLLGTPARWEPVFARELPGFAHRMVLVDGTPSEAALAPWRDAGFVATTNDVMIATELRAIDRPAEITIAPRVDWPALRALTLASDAAEGNASDGYVRFMTARLADQQALVERGGATWWGASRGEALVAGLGLVTGGEGARYQDVVTDLAHRGRGIAAALVAHAGAEALAAGVSHLVIEVAPDTVAQRVYARVGFTRSGTTTTLSRT